MNLSRKFRKKIKSRILGVLCVLSVVLCFVATDRYFDATNNKIKSYNQFEEAKGVTSNYGASETSLTSSDNQQLNYKNEYIKIGDKLDIDIVKVDGETVVTNVSQSGLTWSSSNEDVATIDQNTGVVTGKGIGHTTITAYNSSNGLKSKAIINVYRNKSGAITVPQVEEGDGFTVILKEDGTVWASGLNDCGQLGQGNTINTNIPVQVKIDENTYLTNVRKISNGQSQIIALTTDGELYAWGYNENGVLGQADTENRLYATKVKGINGEGYLKNIVNVEMSNPVVYAINENGEFLGWGSRRL